MTTPKPGDVLTAEQVRNLPDGAVVETTCRYTVTERSAADLAYLASSGENTVTLVSLPPPPDMAPGSVVLDLRERIAADIEAEAAGRGNAGLWRVGMHDAARIARGGQS